MPAGRVLPQAPDTGQLGTQDASERHTQLLMIRGLFRLVILVVVLGAAAAYFIRYIVAEVGAYGASTLQGQPLALPDYSVLELYKRSAEYLKAFSAV